jgi:hypothetical protein
MKKRVLSPRYARVKGLGVLTLLSLCTRVANNVCHSLFSNYLFLYLLQFIICVSYYKPTPFTNTNIIENIVIKRVLSPR